MRGCGECGEVNPGRARFCLACGRPLEATDEETRKTVTILFADVVGSTAAGERYDPEAYQRVLHADFDRFQDLTEAHGGTVEKFIGDAMMAVFGLPRVHEDDALRAVRAAVAMRAAVARAPGGEGDGSGGRLALTWRFGVNTGEVLVGGTGGRTLATGDAVNLAARLEQAAEPGEILVGAATHELVRDAVEAEPLTGLQLRGKAQPVTAFRVLQVQLDVEGRARRADLPFVGREDERALLDWVLQRASRTPAPQLVTVLGDAGIGKTRLVSTVVTDRHRPVLHGRCRAYGHGVPWWPLAEAFADGAGIRIGADADDVVLRKLASLAGCDPQEDLVTTVASTLGLVDTDRPLDPVTALRGYLAALAGETGVVLLLDDLHNAEDGLLDALELLVARARELSLVLLAIARPQLLERRPAWGAGVLNATRVLLAPLTGDETATLVAHRLAGSVAPALVDELVAAADGNPLFLEELVAKLLEDGALTSVDGTWRRQGHGALTVPATIHALLAARLDALERTERIVLARASVVGSRVSLDALCSLTPPSDHPSLEDHLESLVDRALLRREQHTYAFRHQFVRDAVYRALPRRTRADLHQRHARWLMQGAQGPLVDGLVAHHLERVIEERAALDPADPELSQLQEHGADWLLSAGNRALHRGDMAAAAGLLGRGLARLVPDDPRRATALADRGRALGELGDFGAAVAELEQACRVAERTGDRGLCAHARVTAVNVRSNLTLDGWVDEARSVADDAVEVFEQIGDDRGLSRAWGLRAEALYLQAQFAACEDALTRATAYAAEADDELEQRRRAMQRMTVLAPGPRTVAEALAIADTVFDRYPGDDTVAARVLQARAHLLAMRGDPAAARGALAGARTRFQQLGQVYWLAFCDHLEGRIALLTDQRADAERPLRRAIDDLTSMGDRAVAALVAAELVACVPSAQLGDLDQLLARVAADVAADDLEARVWAGLAVARRASAAGDVAAALAAARTASELATTSDGPVLQADALLTLADLAAGAADQRTVAVSAAQQAAERYRRKGHEVGVTRSRRLLRALES